MVGRRTGARSARSHALSVLRVRGAALAVSLLPAAVAVVLGVGGATGRFGAGWEAARWSVDALALLVLAVAGGVAAVIARARPAVTPTVEVPERSAPDLHALVRDLAERLGVPPPSGIALTPDCDSWLEDRDHGAHGDRPVPGAADRPRGAAGGDDGAGRRARAAPVLVIGSPFLWWMRVAELRALLAPVVAGTGPAAHPDISAARRFVRGLDAAVAVAERDAPGGRAGPAGLGLRFAGGCARLMLRASAPHAAEMERGVAAAAADRAQGVDYGLRTTAQEQVGLAYAGWDRLLTRVALPAWRVGRWPSRLDAGVVSALTELSRRDRLADGYAARLGERPACDLLEEPGAVDESISLLAARLFHGGPPDPDRSADTALGDEQPAASGARGKARGADSDWAPVSWQAYPDEVVDRLWRLDASRLFEALDAPDGGSGARTRPRDEAAAADASDELRAGPQATSTSSTPTTPPAHASARAPAHAACGTQPAGEPGGRRVGVRLHKGPAASAPVSAPASDSDSASEPEEQTAVGRSEFRGPTLDRVMERLSAGGETDALAARIGSAVAREEAARGTGPLIAGAVDGTAVPSTAPMGLPVRPPRGDAELVAEHVVAAVCCAAVDTAGARPGMDWLDGPILLAAGRRAADLTSPVLRLVEEGDPRPLRDWLADTGVRGDKPMRLI